VRLVHADIATSSSTGDDQNEVEIPGVEIPASVDSRGAAPPATVLRDFKQYQALKRQHVTTDSAGRHHHITSHHQSSTCHYHDGSRANVVPGIAGHYAMRQGVQYYRDLAGNVKQVISSVPFC